MLQQLYASNIPGLPDVCFDFGPWLTVITGPIGSGKTMRTRDLLFSMLTGRMPSRRTQDCLGPRVLAGVCLAKPDGSSMSVVRSGAGLRILEDSTATGTNAVKARVEQFTGLSSSDLPVLCYCNGTKLQQDMQLTSALLTTIRSAVGPSISQYAKILTQAVSSNTLELREAEAVMSVTQDPLQTQQQLFKAETDLADLLSELEKGKEGLEVSEKVRACPLDDAVTSEMKQIRSRLGPLVDLSEEELLRILDSQSFVEFANTVDAELAEHYQDSYDENASQTLAQVVKDGAVCPGTLPKKAVLDGCRRYRDLQGFTVVTDAQKTAAETYIIYVRRLEQEISQLRSTISTLQGTLAAIKRTEARRKQAAEDNKRLKAVGQRLEVLQTCFQPSGKHSLEKTIVERISGTLMGVATDYLCMCGMHAQMLYDAKAGIQLLRADGEVSSQELSEGESMITALCLRLALIKALKPVPFLILDDITGSLGVRAAVVTDTLRVFSRENNIPIVLNTQELRVTGDVFYALDKV